MTKEELINTIAKKTDNTKATVNQVLKALTQVVEVELTKGEEVRLVGFGTWGVSQRRERKGRNPQTGEEITIPAKKVPVFKPGQSLRDAVEDS